MESYWTWPHFIHRRPTRPGKSTYIIFFLCSPFRRPGALGLSMVLSFVSDLETAQANSEGEHWGQGILGWEVMWLTDIIAVGVTSQRREKQINVTCLLCFNNKLTIEWTIFLFGILLHNNLINHQKLNVELCNISHVLLDVFHNHSVLDTKLFTGILTIHKPFGPATWCSMTATISSLRTVIETLKAHSFCYAVFSIGICMLMGRLLLDTLLLLRADIKDLIFNQCGLMHYKQS